MTNKEQITMDLKDIIEICYKLINHEQINDWNINRAYNILLILKNEFETELKEISEVIPF